VVDEHIRRPSDQKFWHGLGRGQERPHPVSEAECRVGSVEDLTRRNNVQHRESQHDARIVECHPIGASRTTIMARDVESHVAERVHDLNLVASDRAHAVRRMIASRRRAPAVAVPAKVGGDDGEPLSQP
jgi:hypothetical protein